MTVYNADTNQLSAWLVLLYYCFITDELKSFHIAVTCEGHTAVNTSRTAVDTSRPGGRTAVGVKVALQWALVDLKVALQWALVGVQFTTQPPGGPVCV